MKKLGKTLFAFSLLVVLLLAACSKDASNESSEGAKGSNEKGKDKQITLRVGTWEGGDGLAMQQKIADDYMDKNPNVKIEIESVPDQYGTKILTQIAANDAPDIFQIGDGDVRLFMEKGGLENLTPFAEGSNGINYDDYYENVLEVGKIDDNLYTMPKDYSTLAVFYNKKLFDEAGAPYPEKGWTWEEFNDVAKKLTKVEGKNVVQWGVSLPGANQRFLIPLLYGYGGSLISDDGEKYEGYMNSEGSKKALQLYHDMYFKDKITPSNADSEAFKGVNLFETGKVAMDIMGRWPLTGYLSNPNLDFGIVDLPEGPSGEVNSIFYAGYGLYTKSENKDAAWDYLKFLTGAPGSSVFADHAFSAVKSVAEEKGQTTDPLQKPFVDGVANVQMFPERLSPYYQATGSKEYSDMLERLMLGEKMDISKALDETAKKSEEALAKEKK
ncbi:ABC transporter substrate-binding protein [Lederbergia citrea]|uniref:Sugar ABC transporter substrate-binding protein n=1 Tax=Lederbergia citrea TaxID=2833581 RepID=A0A942ULE2_9BACI|nr:sugar ABC transporter substrate-binding protein [Lederbergia citrea]MBS4177350.1 sugar ABC transporter substrate-binding protein [Lederbergia citrea]MBS4204013.1 sugar ABC transporter substrate-binding protein [Lederbergia citrea]MBS4221402.1 sugar ABC transporter substrate-binding protein [Lederbergia citrea]